MKMEITFEIECGETTCAIEKGKYCREFFWTMNGKVRCYFFGDLLETDGWTQRHPECLKRAVKVEA